LKYTDFVDLAYRPKADDVICDFFVEPRDISMVEAAGGIAAESSIGTWTELTTIKPYIEKLAAHVFSISGKNIRVAYPIELLSLATCPTF